MARKKNVLNDKSRESSCAATSTTVTYKIPLKEEQTFLGHFLEYSLVNGELVIKFATKKPDELPAFRIEHFEEPQELLFN